MARRCGKVMIVEDDRALLELLLDYFEAEHVEVFGAENAEEALGHLRETERLPDVILVDLRIPKMSGEELIDVLHADPRWAAIPIAAMSGDPQRLAFTHGEGLPTLAKPFSMDELRSVLALHCTNFGVDAAP